jgi:hypothetical protein
MAAYIDHRPHHPHHFAQPYMNRSIYRQFTPPNIAKISPFHSVHTTHEDKCRPRFVS